MSHPKGDKKLTFTVQFALSFNIWYSVSNSLKSLIYNGSWGGEDDNHEQWTRGSVQVGKAAFVQESCAILGFEPFRGRRAF